MLLHAGGQHVCSWLVSYINMSATDTADVKPLDQSASSALRARDRPASSALRLRARHRPASSALRARDRPSAVLKRKPARRFSDEDAAEKGSVRDAARHMASGPEALAPDSSGARNKVAMARPARPKSQVALGCTTHASSSTSSTPSALQNVIHVQDEHDIQKEKESDRRCLLRELGVPESFPISLAMERNIFGMISTLQSVPAIGAPFSLAGVLLDAT